MLLILVSSLISTSTPIVLNLPSLDNRPNSSTWIQAPHGYDTLSASTTVPCTCGKPPITERHRGLASSWVSRQRADKRAFCMLLDVIYPWYQTCLVALESVLMLQSLVLLRYHLSGYFGVLLQLMHPTGNARSVKDSKEVISELEKFCTVCPSWVQPSYILPRVAYAEWHARAR